MRRRLRVASSISVALGFVALFAATSVEEFVQSDQTELTVLVPLDGDGRHSATLVVEVLAPQAADEWQIEHPWDGLELRISFANPDARRSLRVVDGWTRETWRVRDGATLRAPLDGCSADPCEQRIEVAFEGRRDVSEPVYVTVVIGSVWAQGWDAAGPRIVDARWEPEG